MQIKRIKQLVIEIFKTVNNLNSDFMKNIFTSKQNARVRPHYLLTRSHKAVTYGDESLIILGPKIWNALPTEIKRETSLSRFQKHVSYGQETHANATFANLFKIYETKS